MTSITIRLTLSISLIVLMLTGHSDAKLTPKDAVAVWLLDEGAGDTVKDISENANDGKITGKPKWVDGKFGKGLEVDQLDKIGSATAKGVSKSFLAECLWVKFNDFATESQFGYITSAGTASTRYFYFSSWCAAGPPHDCIHLGTLDLGGAWGRGIVTNKIFDKNKWYFVCGVIDNKEGTIRAYVDGVLKHDQAFAKGDTPGTPGQIWLGGTPENYQWIKGTVDEVAFFNVAVTPDDMKSMMKDGVGRTVGILAVDPAGKIATTWGSIKGQ
jgi:hypothetical protein